MPETAIESMARMEEAMKKLPKDAAERIAYEAAIRAEAVADYAERTETANRPD